MTTWDHVLFITFLTPFSLDGRVEMTNPPIRLVLGKDVQLSIFYLQSGWMTSNYKEAHRLADFSPNLPSSQPRQLATEQTKKPGKIHDQSVLVVWHNCGNWYHRWWWSTSGRLAVVAGKPLACYGLLRPATTVQQSIFSH